ncbi:MAG: winged helix-turn-helix domain-containing protein [Terriglobales bacterium]
MSVGDRHLYEFGPYRVDPDERLLLRENQPIPLQPKAFETLLVLIRNSQKVVLKDDLMKSVWPDSFVEESNLSQNIFVLRKALGEAGGRYIVTVPGRGYRFVGEVNEVTPQAEAEDEIIFATHSRSQVVVDEDSRHALWPALTAGKRRFRLAAWLGGLAVLVIIGFVVWRQTRLQRTSMPARVMLAVLPFQNLTGDPEQEYFADGLTEEMITKLGGLHPEQLGVIARTSVMGYKHGDKRLDQIGRELSVQYVLEGSFRGTADRFRITAQLIRVKDQSHLWAEDYDRSLQDVITVQDDVATSVAREIQIRLTPQQLTELSHASAVNPQAYEDYLKGRYFWNKRTEDGFRKAIEHFEAAIARDPNYAQAYAGLADANMLMGGYGFAPQKDFMPKAKAAARKALAIDDRLAEAYASLGLIDVLYEWNWAEAEKNFTHAIELDPNYSVAHHYYGDGYLALVGRNDEGIAELRKAHELDPLSLVIDVDLARRLCGTGRRDEALAEFRNVLDADPNYVAGRYYLSECYEREKLYAQAIAEAQTTHSPGVNLYATAWLGYLYAVTSRRKEALGILEELQRQSRQTNVDPGNVAHIYIALGEKDLAFAWLEKAYNERSPSLVDLKSGPFYDPIRSDPRFADLVRRVGIP